MNVNIKKKEIGILGAGSQAIETAGYLVEAGYQILFFFVQSKYSTDENELSSIAPIITEKDNLKDFGSIPVISAVGSPVVKKILVELWPYNIYTSFIHSTAWVAKSAEIGTDVTIPPMAVLNTKVKIADHVLLNIGVTLSHDVEIGQYCTISPGVHVAGKSTVGEGSFLGIGVNVVDSKVIGRGTIIAAGALVKNDVESQTMVAGVPAKKIKVLSVWY